MKKLTLFMVAVLFAACAPTEPMFKVEGSLDGLTTGKVYLSNMDRTEVIRDTADIVDGKFIFEGKVVTPEMYIVTVEGTDFRLPIFLENADFSISGSLEKGQAIGGGVSHSLMTQVNNKTEELAKTYKMDEIFAEYSKEGTTQDRKDEILAINQKYMTESGDFKKNIIDQNPDSYFALADLVTKIEADLPKVKAAIEVFAAKPENANNRVIKNALNTIAIIEKVSVGQTAPEITSLTPDGEELSLSDLYADNKVIMIDFWAGWCPPCRAFNPKLVEIYNKYNKDGFEVLGVSFDRDRDTWLKAIEDDKLTWPQVSDILYWDNEDAKTYHVRAIPMNMFVDNNGKIIARNLPKDQIEAFLDEHLNK